MRKRRPTNEGSEIFLVIAITCLSVAVQVCRCDAEIGRDPRGSYVPLNSLTITSLYNNDKPAGEESTPSTFKPWWADLQKVSFLFSLFFSHSNHQ